MSKLRHPFILRVNKPIEESKTSIVSVTIPHYLHLYLQFVR